MTPPSARDCGPWAELTAPPSWRELEFISDLHLQASEPATCAVWQRHMAHTSADAVFILGDLFEAWVGDDVLATPPGDFERHCAHALLTTASQRPVYAMHGNRDFLLGTTFAQACHITLLPDPTVLCLGGERWALAHGDALCLDDTAYMAFRAQVRQPDWQQAFLQRPLAERQAIARAMRDHSEKSQRSAHAQGMPWADVHPDAVSALLDLTQATTLLHGHTHRPATHRLERGRQRVVLSDWDAAAHPPRAEVLRLTVRPHGAGLTAQRLPLLG